MENDILEIIAEVPDDLRLNHRRGASLSSVMAALRDRGWRNLGSMDDFITDVEALGFKIENLQRKDGSPIFGRLGITL